MALMKAVAADEAAVRMRLRLRDQMFGAAEADFQPHVVERLSNSARRSAGAGLVRSSASFGSSVSNSAAWRGRNGWPLRRPKKARCDAQLFDRAASFMLPCPAQCGAIAERN